MNILISGGSSGIGKATVERLLKDGHKVVFTYQFSGDSSQDFVKTNREKYGADSVDCFKADITKEDEIQELVTEAVDFFGAPVEGLVNNAGITRDGLAVRMSEADFNAVIQTNLTGAFLLSKAVIPGMMKARHGRIVNLSSISGLYGNQGQANYSASKAGLVGLTKSLSKELAKRNILVNAVAPGMIETSMTAKMTDKAKQAAMSLIGLGRLGQASEVASVISFLMSEDSSYVTGQVIEVSGGMLS